MAKVTIGDVAREAGVALGTVSNALNHPEKVKPDTLKIVNDAIRKLGYAPNQSARLLAGGTNPTFGLVVPQLNHGLSLQIASGASTEAQRQGYGLLVATANGEDALEQRYARYFMGTQMSGVLVQASHTHAYGTPTQFGHTPIAYLDMTSDAPGYFVAADSRGQGSLIADHVVSLGAHHIAVIGDAAAPQDSLRLEGIRSTMELHPEVTLTVIAEGAGNMAADGFELGMRIARMDVAERPDAIIGLTDVLATGAIAGIVEAGLAVPGDIAVAGCDGNPLAWSGTVPLTTCAPMGYEMGRRGIHHLVEQIKARKSGMRSDAADENHQELVRPFMLTRESTVGRSPVTATDTIGLNLGTFL
ncbi:LacI family DNA-binding transcriptional regulator [Collinsella tanakaei]|uniref:LacI family DNA-binding transcriptional regulator n=1 Tax=Collinsella tanakaei TaxID=626935 RepID=UPI0025A418C9|nr:LacI family DNA-binding transcriptional regulator [Collinsella tanakaei]MDM8246249.1 LacI family DNA-binding transcriptional regulator [Collinsella tanakaei]